MYEDVIPRGGGYIITGSSLGRTVDTSWLVLGGGSGSSGGARIIAYGKNSSETGNKGAVSINCYSSSNSSETMRMYPSGTWTWTGSAVQLTSDQRLKQQITQIDNALLDAWEDVELVQFKYNDAVNEKGDNARLHTGYVVQQIDDACKSHNIDISEYGLYCHEEYPERTEEVEVQQDDGAIKKETKVIEPAKEYYSLRYTETLVVECAYLRRENAKLKEQLQNHENYLKLVEEHLHLKNL